MSIIEWIAVTEAVLLLAAGIFWLTGFAVGRDNPDDPFTIFYTTFWRIFLRRRGRLRSAVTALDQEKARKYEEMKQTGDVEGIKDLLTEEFGAHQFDESEISAALDESIGPPAAEEPGGGEVGATRVAVLSIQVIPFAPQAELVSWRRDGVTIQVPCGPEEGQANKAVIDLVAAALSIKPYQVTLLKGHYKAFKSVQIAGFSQHELDLKMASMS